MAGRDATPTLGIIDSRSIKSSHHVDTDKGVDGNKKIEGRKEHIVVDTLGLPMAIVVHPANIHDRVGAHEVINVIRAKYLKLKKILADGGYRGEKLIAVAKVFSNSSSMDCGAFFRLAGKLQENCYGL